MILPSVDPVTLLRLARHNDEELALFFDFCSHSRRRGGGVAARCACQQPTEERCKNFRSVAVIYLSAADFGANNSV
jgi:hypothetical protein